MGKRTEPFKPDPITMLAVYTPGTRGRSTRCVGHVVSRGKTGFESFEPRRQVTWILSQPEIRGRCHQRGSAGGAAMSAVRARLANRRASQQFVFTCNDQKYVATVSFFADGRLAEILLGNMKSGSHADSAAKDAAVVCSIALQHGVPVDVIQHALLRDARGVASSVLGAALDLICGELEFKRG